MTKRIFLAVTGGSGMPYAVRLAEVLGARDDVALHLVVTTAARKVLAVEASLSADTLLNAAERVYDEDEIEAGPSSGSWPHHGMVVCPCSMHTLAAVAAGMAGNLVQRAADVCLKERRRLILMVRETPYSRLHLRNMLAATEAGAVIMPASPGFYGNPARVADLVDFMVARVLDHLGLEHSLGNPWEG